MGLIFRVSEYDFIRAFEHAGRGSQFSSDGLSALFSYLEELSEDVDEDYEVDVIGLCCDYTEYERPSNSELEDWEGEDDMRDSDDYADDVDTAQHHGFDHDDIVVSKDSFVIVQSS